MDNKMFIGSLPWAVTDEDLKDAFSACGTVVSAQVIKDRATGRSKGFGFVEMSSAEEAQAAIAKMNGADLGGRAIAVSIAKPMTDRPKRSFQGGGGHDFGGRRDRQY